MILPQAGRINYPPRSYQTCGELMSELPMNSSHPQRDRLEFNSASTREEPPVFNSCSAKASNNLTHPSPESSIVDDWTWECFSIGVGAGTVHLMLADLNRHNKKLIWSFEVLFYFTDVISFMCNMIILILQYFRDGRRMKRTFENAEKSSFLPLIPINIATIVVGSFRYGIASGWLQLDGAICLFHCYIILLISILMPHCLKWSKLPYTLENFPTSFCLLPIPTLFIGVMASHLLEVISLESKNSLDVLITGYLFGGFGMTLALLYMLVYLFKIVHHGHASGEQTVIPILVAGFPAFCAKTVMGLGSSSRIIFFESPNMKLNDTLGEVWYGTGILAGVILLGSSLAVVFMAIFNSWWKFSIHHIEAPTSRAKLNMGMISMTFSSWAISSACSSLYLIFESTWLRAIQLLFMACGVITYLVILPTMIIRYFKKILSRKQLAFQTSPPVELAPQIQDQRRSTELRDMAIHHPRYMPRCPHSSLEDQSRAWKPYQNHNARLSQDTLVVGQSTKPDLNLS